MIRRVTRRGKIIQGVEEIQAKTEGIFQQISVFRQSVGYYSFRWLGFDLKFSRNKNRVPLIVFETHILSQKLHPKKRNVEKTQVLFAAAPWEAWTRGSQKCTFISANTPRLIVKWSLTYKEKKGNQRADTHGEERSKTTGRGEVWSFNPW